LGFLAFGHDSTQLEDRNPQTKAAKKLLLSQIARRSMMRLKSSDLVKAHDASVDLGIGLSTVATLDGSRAVNPH
jgi:hypothetical protein